MSEWVTIIPDEFHYVTKRARTLADVDAYIRSAHETVVKVNKLIPSAGELVITCCFWSAETHWVVKATLFGSDHQFAVFGMMWAWR